MIAGAPAGHLAGDPVDTGSLARVLNNDINNEIVTFGAITPAYLITLDSVITDSINLFFDPTSPLTIGNTSLNFEARYIFKIITSGIAFEDGFEIPNVGPVGQFGSFRYNPAGSIWTFQGTSGIASNGSGFTSLNPNAPEGVQVAFIQQTGNFVINKFLNAGSYNVSLKSAQRGSNTQKFRLTVDGINISDFQPTNSNYEMDVSAIFTVASGIHTINFVGLNPLGGDNTVLIDDVTINLILNSLVQLINDVNAGPLLKDPSAGLILNRITSETSIGLPKFSSLAFPTYLRNGGFESRMINKKERFDAGRCPNGN